MSEYDIRRKLNRIEHLCEKILHILERPASIPTGVQITQISKQGEILMSITGTNVGGSSTFEADALLAGVADPAGFPAGSVDTWTADDPSIVIGPDSGPNNSQVLVSLPKTYTKADYGLTVSVQMPGTPPPAPLTSTVRVPANPAPPPVPDGVVISQIS
jgi:hypothetical protein